MLSARIAFVLACASLLAVTACGDDAAEGPLAPGLEGKYMTTSHTRNEQGCEQEGDEIPTDDFSYDPYFILETDEIFGERFIGYYPCEGPDSCEADPMISAWALHEKVDGQWQGTLSASSYGGDNCSLTLQRWVAFDEGADIRFEQQTFRGTLTGVSDSECEPELAEARLGELACEEFEVLRATSEF